jgi:signal transduction histidine kinase
VNRVRTTAAAKAGNPRLARKVHDDISQKLTVLGLELAVLEMKIPKSNRSLAAKVQQLSRLTTEIAMSVREVMEALSAKSK